MWKHRSTRRKNHSRLARYTDRNETDIGHQRPAVCCCRSKLMTNKLPRACGGYTASLESHIFLGSLHHREGSSQTSHKTKLK